MSAQKGFHMPACVQGAMNLDDRGRVFWSVAIHEDSLRSFHRKPGKSILDVCQACLELLHVFLPGALWDVSVHGYGGGVGTQTEREQGKG
jgi:hypothetical protein